MSPFNFKNPENNAVKLVKALGQKCICIFKIHNKKTRIFLENQTQSSGVHNFKV